MGPSLEKPSLQPFRVDTLFTPLALNPEKLRLDYLTKRLRTAVGLESLTFTSTDRAPGHLVIYSRILEASLSVVCELARMDRVKKGSLTPKKAFYAFYLI